MIIDRNTVVTVFGGSGFVGRYIVRLLAKTGARVRVAVRNPNTAMHVLPAGNVGQVTAVPCNVNHYKSVEDAVRGADIVINCVGILNEVRKQTFQTIHVEGADHIAHASMRLSVRKLIHISAIGANENSESEYAKSKGLAEKHVMKYYPKATILRPSLVFGPEDNFFNRFASMVSISPFLPLIGMGTTKFQPIYVGDIAEAVVFAVTHDEAQGQIYELGGSEVLSFKQLLQKTLYHIGRCRILLPVPYSVAYLKAWFLEKLPNAMLTCDQVSLLRTDNVVSHKYKTIENMEITPKKLDMILPSYLRRYRKAGTYNYGKGFEYKSQDEV